MTKVEFAQVSIGLKAAYPRFKMLSTDEEMTFWYQMLSDIDYQVVNNAVLEHISTCTFPPSVAEIRKLCADRCTKPIPCFDDAWGSVMNAISSFGWNNPVEAYKTLDELTLEIVKNIGWNALCLGDNQAANRANFREAYEKKARERMEQRQIPVIVQQQKNQLIEQYVPKEYWIEGKKQEEIPEKESPAGEGPPEHIKQRLNELLRR